MISRSLWESALELQSLLSTERLDFAFIGGRAIQRWGQCRYGPSGAAHNGLLTPLPVPKFWI